MSHKSDELELAARHVDRGREIVERQRALIARLRAKGHQTWEYECTLAIFLDSLAIFEEHERELRSSGHDRATVRRS